jgi:hypothetical protein
MRMSRWRSYPWAEKSAASRSSAGGRSPVVGRSSTGSTRGRPRRIGPDAVDRRPGEVRVPRVDDPRGELLARGALAGLQLGPEGHARRDGDGLLGLGVEGLEDAVAVVDAGEVGADAAEEGGQAAEVVLLPGLERVVVALGAVEPDAQEGPGHAGGDALGIGAFGLSSRVTVRKFVAG